MTTTLTGSSSYSNTATAPADGDVRNAASVNTPLQTVLNNTKYLYDFVNGFGRVVKVGHLYYNTLHTTTSNTYVDATGYAINLGTLAVGDVVFVASCLFHLTDGTGQSIVNLAVEENGTPTESSIERATTSGSAVYQTMIFSKTVASAGQAYARIRHYVATIGDSRVSGAEMFAIVVRP